MTFRLAVDDGRFSRTLEVREDVTVGSANRCGLKLESEGVARRHARLRQCGTRVVVEDLGARDGVHVAGQRVKRASLSAGQSVRIGKAQVRVLDVLPEPRKRRRVGGAAAPFRPLPLGASAAAHVIALIVLWSWVAFEAPPPEPPPVIAASVPDREPDVPETPEVVPTVDPLEEAKREEAFELPPEEDPETVLEPDPRFLPPEPAPPSEDPPPEPPEPAPTTMGVGADPAFVSKSFGKGEAGSANRVAAGLLDDDPGAAAALRAARGGASESSVWVVRGDYDQAEKVLGELGVDHAIVSRDELETRVIPASVRVLFYNCTGHALSRDAQGRIAHWASQGGWVVTTDWALERLLEHGFPGTLVPLRVADRPVLTKDETVGVRATTDRGLAEGLPLGEGMVARWWLEDTSVPFVVPQGIGAEVLVRSEELERRFGAGAVAVTFEYGQGRVLHLLGHVYQQEGNLRGTVIVQRLVVNYLAAALAR